MRRNIDRIVDLAQQVGALMEMAEAADRTIDSKSKEVVRLNALWETEKTMRLKFEDSCVNALKERDDAVTKADRYQRAAREHDMVAEYAFRPTKKETPTKHRGRLMMMLSGHWKQMQERQKEQGE